MKTIKIYYSENSLIPFPLPFPTQRIAILTFRSFDWTNYAFSPEKYAEVMSHALLIHFNFS